MTLPIWIVYDHPLDAPDCFIARLWLNDQPTQTTLRADTLEGLREMLPAHLTMLPRQDGDDPVIVETWI